MLILYPDTNALHADLLMIRANSRQLIDVLLPGEVEVALSPVVLAEARRRAAEAGEETVREVRASLRDIERKHGVPTAGAEPAVAALIAEVSRASSLALRPLTDSAACQQLSWPVVESEELVAREIDRRAPSRLKGDQSIGLRDTIIWHGLVDLMRSIDEDDRVLFITADGGFLQGGELAQELVAELEAECLDPLQLKVVPRLENAVVEANERRELLTRQEGIIRQAVIDHLAGFAGRSWASVDVSGDAPLRYGLEEGIVAAVDSITISAVTGNPPTTVEATADITVSGFMRTDEYMQEYSDVVEWMHGEIFDPMIGVDFTSTVVLEAQVELSVAGDEAWVNDESLRWVN